MKIQTTKSARPKIPSTKIPVLIVLLSICATARAASVVDWQGEWGHWFSSDLGASISITACSETTSSCRLRLDAESKQTRCEFRGEGDGLELKLDIAGRASAEAMNHGASECRLNLQLENIAGNRQLHLDFSGPNCSYFCTEGTAIAQSYPFHLAESYPPNAQQACFADDRDSRQVWCLDAKIQALDTRLYDLGSKYDALKHDNSLYQKQLTAREAALKTCHAAKNISDCLLHAYSNDVSEFEHAVAIAQTEHDKAETLLAQKGDAAQATALIAQIDGVYKKQFANGNVDGEHYTSEDILEIVRVAEDAVYFRTSLAFFNGHSCGVHGIARLSQAGVFVFNDTQTFADDAVCRLQFDVSDKAITIKDPDYSCRNYCGARGSFNGETFLRSARRTIRYMTILKNSEQYKEATGTLDKP